MTHLPEIYVILLSNMYLNSEQPQRNFHTQNF